MRFTKLNHNSRRFKSLLFLVALVVIVLSASGCMRDMQDQPRYEPLEQTDFFGDNQSSRTLVEGTVAVGTLKPDDYKHTGKVSGEFGNGFPMTVTSEILERGQDRFNIYCSVCHGNTGYGDGMVVRRGFPEAASYHDERLRNAPEGYIFHTITNGFGKMASYADVLNVDDRWAVIAYIRALQRSQNTSLDALSAKEKEILKHGGKEDSHDH